MRDRPQRPPGSAQPTLDQVERKLNKLDGVTASVNYATERAVVHTSVPDEVLVAEVTRAGYRGEVLGRDRPTGGPAADVRRIWQRLVTALLLGVPAADLSLTLALVPALRFPGRQFVVLVLGLPVVTWCAWPFHAEAAAAPKQRDDLHGHPRVDRDHRCHPLVRVRDDPARDGGRPAVG